MISPQEIFKNDHVGLNAYDLTVESVNKLVNPVDAKLIIYGIDVLLYGAFVKGKSAFVDTVMPKGFKND